jgi:hypothetical protein
VRWVLRADGRRRACGRAAGSAGPGAADAAPSPGHPVQTFREQVPAVLYRDQRRTTRLAGQADEVGRRQAGRAGAGLLGLGLDMAAVIAAVILPIHNGRTEGVNTKTKMIKRQMYGRETSPSCATASCSAIATIRHHRKVRQRRTSDRPFPEDHSQTDECVWAARGDLPGRRGCDRAVLRLAASYA